MANCNLYLKANAVELLFDATTGSSISDIFQWDSGSPNQPPVQLTAGNAWNFDPQTDGTILAWTSKPNTAAYEIGDLVVTSTANPTTQTTLSTDVSLFQFQVKDGFLGWPEIPNQTTPGIQVKAFDGLRQLWHHCPLGQVS